MNLRYIPIANVLARMNGSRSSLYVKMNEGLFPASVKVGERRVAWLEHEVDAMMAYVSCPSQEELKAFVKSLEAKRLAVEVSDV
jgi:prophage regulatory protein